MHRLFAASPRLTRLTRATGAAAAALVTAGVCVGLCLGAGLGLVVAPAAAAATSVPTTPPTTPPTPAPTSAAPYGAETPAAAAAPTITSPAAGAFIGSGQTDVSGSRAPGEGIQLFVGETGTDPVCIVEAAAQDTWNCANVPLPNGASVTLRAVVTGEAARSGTSTITVLAPPRVAAEAGVVLSNGLVHGSAVADAQVTVSVTGSDGTASGCSIRSDGHGNWACVLNPTPSDGHYRISATQVGPEAFGGHSSEAATPLPLVFDTVAPAAPTLVSPAAGSQPAAGVGTAFGGNGESGARVTVWAATSAGSQQLCSATVAASGAWGCVGNAPAPGTYTISALQQDAAGNTSAASAAVTLRVVAPSSQPTPETTPGQVPGPGPTRSPGASTAPAYPPWSVVPPQTTPTPAAPTTPATPAPQAGPLESSTPGSHLPATTPFTAAVTTLSSTHPLSTWLPAAALAMLALALLFVPARLLAGAVADARRASGRAAAPATRLFGRNRGRNEYDQPPALRAATPWVNSVAAGVIATALVTFSGPIQSADAYLRVVPAIFLALCLVGAVAVCGPLLWARTGRHAGSGAASARRVTVSFAPYTLVLVAAASVLSRMLQLQPALLYGVILVATVTTGSVAVRGRLAAVQLGSLAALAGAGWMLLAVLPSADTGPTAFIAEFVNASILLAIGSAGVLLLPIGSLPGRAILRWSTGMWLVLTVAIETLLFAILVPAQHLAGHGPGTVLIAVGMLGFAAVSVSAWLWQRYIAPTLR